MRDVWPQCPVNKVGETPHPHSCTPVRWGEVLGVDQRCAGNVANVNKVLSGPCPPRSSVVIESGPPAMGCGGGIQEGFLREAQEDEWASGNGSPGQYPSMCGP